MKKRIINKPTKICDTCGLEHNRIRGAADCKICHNRKHRKAIKNDPEKWAKTLEYFRKKHREKVRLKRGLPFDYPRLRRNDGEGTIHKEGYKIISIGSHPNAQKRGLILEHILIMSNHLGRPLKKHENVHHKNGDRSDNSLENLELWTRKQPPGQRVEDKVKWCKEFLEEYGNIVILKENPQ